METVLTLGEAERRVLLDLLDQERGELHQVIHHTSPGGRVELKERLLVVEHLVARLREREEARAL
ncbi:MAG: hypothetical protein HYY93_03265 [Planctomycetes bacterium]|nr:hypothetical protein [Planctomycetota bacterium]